MLDVWAHAHRDDPKLREQMVTEGFEEELLAAEAEMAAEVEMAAAADAPGLGPLEPDDTEWDDVEEMAL